MHQIKGKKTELFIVCLLCMVTACCKKIGENISQESGSPKIQAEQSKILSTVQTFISGTLKEDCVLCGSGKGTMIPMYRGQKNLGIISMKTMDISYIGINQYDDDGNLIEKQVEQSSTTMNTYRDGGFASMISENPDRGFATGSITFFESASLDIQKASEYLCTECINNMEECCWSDVPYGIGLIDFSERKIRLFESGVSGFMFGDYYVSCNYHSRKGQKNQDMDFLIFYCPERYN